MTPKRAAASNPSWAPQNPRAVAAGILGPRDHQAEDVPALATLLAEPDSRTQYLAACGTGKTLTGMWTVQALDARRVVVFFPTLALIDQTMREWARAADPERPLEMAALCSPIPGDLAAEACAYPATTDVAATSRFWNAAVEGTARRVLFVCYPSTPKLEQVLAEPDAQRADLVICDEAHHIAGEVGKDSQAILDDERVPADRRLFMTATPVWARIDDDPDEAEMARGKARGTRMIGMDMPELFGSSEVARGFRWAIEQEILTDYQVVTPEPLGPVARKAIRQFEAAEAALAPRERMPEGYWTKAFMLAREISTPEGARRVFTFHSKVRHAQQFAAAVAVAARELGHPDVFTQALSGEDPVEARRAALETLRQSPAGVVASVNVLTEGVDAPAVDGVAMIDMRRSVVQIAQAVGRAIRTDRDNPTKIARIIVPVELRRDDSARNRFQDEGHRMLYVVLTALGESDERLRAYAQAVRVAQGGTAPLPQEQVDYFARMLQMQHAVTLSDDDRRALLDGLRTHVVREFSHTFKDYYAACESYARVHGTIRCGVDTQWEGLNIGRFLSQQRAKYKSTAPARRTDPRRQLLEALPGWALDLDEAQWQETAVALGAWMERHGRMPESTATDDEERTLGVWAKNQKAGRQAAVGGGNTQRTPLSESRYRFLCAVAPQFQFSLTREEQAAAAAAREAEAEERRKSRAALRQLKAMTAEARAALGITARRLRELERAAADPKGVRARLAAAEAPVSAPEDPTRWQASFEAMETWVRAQRTEPSREGASRAERDLAGWWQRQRWSLDGVAGSAPLSLGQRVALARLQLAVEALPPREAERAGLRKVG